MENDLISRKALITDLRTAKGLGSIIAETLVRFLKKQPTVDAVEVVHGEWEIIEDDYFDLVEMKCSVCGESYGFEDYEDDTPQNYHYCPNCGAKMDGERREGE